MSRRLVLAAVAAAAVAAAACGATTGSAPARTSPPANDGFDYQLGGAYPPPAGVAVVARDRTEAPADAYTICYVNGFQTQPDEGDWWLADHADLVLRDGSGDPVGDPEWPDEMFLDITTPEKRSRVAAIVGDWIDGCAADGFDAVEIDNLDSYARSGGQISQDAAVDTIRLLRDRAHAAGLPIGQKNAAGLLDRPRDLGLDFAVAEECNRYDECDDYVGDYGDRVFVIEYRRADFDQGCAAYPGLSIVHRDRGLAPAGTAGHVHHAC